MLSVADFLAELPEADHKALANAIGAGLHDARLAAQCLTDPGAHAEDVAQLLAYLSRAIRELEAAREIVRPRA
jgi:hypothetical protein